MGTLWRSRAKVHELIKLLFGVMSGVGPVIGVLYGGPHRHPQSEMGGIGGFDGSLLVWDLPLRQRQRNVFGLCEKI